MLQLANMLLRPNGLLYLVVSFTLSFLTIYIWRLITFIILLVAPFALRYKL